MHVAIQTQAPDIAQKVHIDKAPEDVGAGDQVNIYFSYMHTFCIICYVYIFRE